jgi:hypothetical protein
MIGRAVTSGEKGVEYSFTPQEHRLIANNLFCKGCQMEESTAHGLKNG